MAKESMEIWNKAAQTIINAGMIPIVLSDILIQLLQELITLEQAEFVSFFEKPSLNIDELKEKTGLQKDELEKMLSSLMFAGVIVGIPSKRTGVMVYRLLGPFPGLFEYTNLRGETGEKQQRLALLFEKLFEEMSDFTQDNYDVFMQEAHKFPPIARILAVEEEIEPDAGDKILPLEEVSRIIDKFDKITLAHCYCRHSKDLMNDPCSVTDERLNCLLLGKSAEFASEYEFGKRITKEEAKKVLEKASHDGLVHKAFHIHLNKDLDEEAICNCCHCCCGPFQMYFRGAAPYHCYTNYIAVVLREDCSACETCVDICPMGTIEMENDAARVIEDKCIGCGLCAYHCPDDAIQLNRGDMRQVFIPPKRVARG